MTTAKRGHFPACPFAYFRGQSDCIRSGVTLNPDSKMKQDTVGLRLPSCPPMKKNIRRGDVFVLAPRTSDRTTDARYVRRDSWYLTRNSRTCERVVCTGFTRGRCATSPSFKTDEFLLCAEPSYNTSIYVIVLLCVAMSGGHTRVRSRG